MLGFSDGVNVRAMLPAQDHKRALDGDRGPNTGGMGAYCPCPLLPPAQLDWVEKQVLQQTVDGLRQEGCPFVGKLFYSRAGWCSKENEDVHKLHEVVYVALVGKFTIAHLSLFINRKHFYELRLFLMV